MILRRETRITLMVLIFHWVDSKTTKIRKHEIEGSETKLKREREKRK